MRASIRFALFSMDLARIAHAMQIPCDSSFLPLLLDRFPRAQPLCMHNTPGVCRIYIKTRDKDAYNGIYKPDPCTEKFRTIFLRCTRSGRLDYYVARANARYSVHFNAA